MQMNKDSQATCKGSFSLGTACGTCSKCWQELEKMKAKKPHHDQIYSIFDELETGGIVVRIYDGRYQWGYDTRWWEEIPKYLYDALVKFNKERGNE